jgi:hypothetical protein
MTQLQPRKLTFSGRVLKLIACVTLVRKEGGEKITFFKSFVVNKVNELVLNTNKLTNNFAGLVTIGFGPDVACGPPLRPRLSII